MSEKIKIPVEVYSRVVGYFRPIDQWNKGKQSEFKGRKPYRIDKALAKMNFIRRREDDKI